MADKVKSLERELQDRDAKIKQIQGQLATLNIEKTSNEGQMKQKIQTYQSWDCFTDKRLQDKKKVIRETRKRREEDIARECEEVAAKMEQLKKKVDSLQQRVEEWNQGHGK